MNNSLFNLNAHRRGLQLPVFFGKISRRLCLWLLFITAALFNAQAQDFFPQQRNDGIRLGADTQIPGKSLSTNYRSGMGITGSYLKFWGKFTVEAGLSYRKYWAKHGVFIDRANPSNVSYTIISPYQSGVVFISGSYNFMETGKVNVYGGLNAGAAYSKSDYGHYDGHASLYITGKEIQAYVAPKIGGTYQLSNSLNLDMQINYHVFTNSPAFTYNAATVAIDKKAVTATALSLGLGLIYQF